MEGFVDNKIIMEKCHVAFTALIPKYECFKTAKFSIADRAEEQLAVTATMWLLDGHKQDVRKVHGWIMFPSTPWQFFKQKYMPEWFKSRWPVEYKSNAYVTEIHHHYVCPHVSPDDDPCMHYAWMGHMSGQIEEQEKHYGEERK